MSPELYTIGHSVHAHEAFFDLLRKHSIEVLVDVRTQPYSRHVPRFNLEALQIGAAAAGFRFLYLGRELGGYPPAPDLFGPGLERLQAGMARFRVAAVCAEEDPAQCHRHKLIGAALQKLSIPVHHIRGDGSLETWESTERRRIGSGEQYDLFG